MRRARIRRLALLLALATGTAAVTAALAPGAGAAPIDDKKKQAAALEAEINANADKLASLYEQIKAAEDKLAQANQTIDDAQSRITAAQTETGRLAALVHQRAASVYRSASAGGDAGIFDTDLHTLSARDQYASAASRRDGSLMAQFKAARADLLLVRRDAQDAKQAAETEKSRLDASKADFESSQGERQRLLGQVQGDIKNLVDQAAKARAAAEAPKGRGGSTFVPGDIPPASGSAGIAVSYARAQVGKAYQYAGTGPDAFDCSGLTMMAWRQAGVGMAHNSEAQYGSFPHVPMNALQPGDIVWFPGHVGLYVGGGAVVDAGNENSGVRYSSVGMFQGAVRPG